jgi:hypothetical protein
MLHGGQDGDSRMATERYDESENGKLAMQVNVLPDLETLINKRLSHGGYGAAEESWTCPCRDTCAEATALSVPYACYPLAQISSDSATN